MAERPKRRRGSSLPRPRPVPHPLLLEPLDPLVEALPGLLDGPGGAGELDVVVVVRPGELDADPAETLLLALEGGVEPGRRVGAGDVEPRGAVAADLDLALLGDVVGRLPPGRGPLSLPAVDVGLHVAAQALEDDDLGVLAVPL